ncbi:hypothetical protein [Streptomonospora salina]|uniref:Aminoglycoside phosphotransferase n=1 Tax=Streptomonospora salina TaxID=104205 RepID=A0A841E8P9_9ACTN|nr:hypothetical protein [Streptomonospora salina]MBB5999302.1 hypothetical protein [Streptomonospora salina]
MNDLPGPELRALIAPHTGEVSDIRPAQLGHSADVTAVIECEKGPFFVKAVPNRPGGKRASLVREGLINPYVQPLSPAVLWQAEDDAWTVLGFEVIQGRTADFTPGSPDLPAVVELLNRIRRLPLPDMARDWEETRWDRFTADEPEAAHLRGDTLLFTDLNPNNFIVGGGRTWAVDWSWPTRGAALIDPASFLVQLVAAGHSPTDADAWANECDAWTSADSAAIAVFVAATVRMYRAFAECDPAQWRKAMVAAVETWADYRNVSVPA